MRTFILALAAVTLLPTGAFAQAPAEKAAPAPAEKGSARRPANDRELQAWLENMVWWHRFSDAEIAAATGLSVEAAAAARQKLPATGRPVRKADDPLTVLPYPGGRHPRIGFLEGAVDPQRETKVSVFLPWNPEHYVVADVPEAIWLKFGEADRVLLYLAHTHVPTLWTKQNVQLEPLEWSRQADGALLLERTLPNKVKFGTKVWSTAAAVRMEMWLTNGSEQKLTGLRVQNCVMLKGAPEFAAQTQENKVHRPPYSTVHDAAKRRWVITAWLPNARAWGNDQCPCLHSDPQFADCAPGETQRLAGWLSFYEGTDIEAELKRIEGTGWHKDGK